MAADLAFIVGCMKNLVEHVRRFILHVKNINTTFCVMRYIIEYSRIVQRTTKAAISAIDYK